LIGTIAAPQYLFVPSINKQYIVDNGLTFPIIIANGSNSGATGTTITVPAGLSTVVFNDGVNMDNPVSFIPSLSNVTINGGTANALTLTNVTVSSGSINGITSNGSTFSNVTIVSGSGNSLSLTNTTLTTSTLNGGTANGVTQSNVTVISGAVGNVTVNGYTEAITIGYGNTGSANTISISNTTIITANLSASCTFTMPTATAGKSFTVLLKTGAGSRTGVFTGVRWNSGNTAPTVTTTANRLDIFTFVADGSVWYGSYAQNYIP
jgi:hypothetical protein